MYQNYVINEKNSMSIILHDGYLSNVTKHIDVNFQFTQFTIFGETNDFTIFTVQTSNDLKSWFNTSYHVDVDEFTTRTANFELTFHIIAKFIRIISSENLTAKIYINAI